jgi:hypothetical protein
MYREVHFRLLCERHFTATWHSLRTRHSTLSKPDEDYIMINIEYERSLAIIGQQSEMMRFLDTPNKSVISGTLSPISISVLFSYLKKVISEPLSGCVQSSTHHRHKGH